MTAIPIAQIVLRSMCREVRPTIKSAVCDTCCKILSYSYHVFGCKLCLFRKPLSYTNFVCLKMTCSAFRILRWLYFMGALLVSAMPTVQELAMKTVGKPEKRDWLFQPISSFLQTLVDGFIATRGSSLPQNGTGVSWETMDMYAAYAGAAYNISDTWNCGYECKHPGTEDTHVEYRWDAPLITSDGYIARNPSRKIIVVAFRGSAEAGDWIEDFTGNPVQWPETIADSIVVLGFLSGYLVSSSSVVQHTAKLAAQYPDHGISAVGHSLGGARAAMFVADISIKHPQLLPRVQLYTYGQAKVGNPAFAAYMNGLGMPIYRVVNRGDIAPHLPYNNSRIVHFGTEVWITANNKTVVCQSSDYSLCSESLPPAAFNIRDHSTYPGL